MEIRLSHEAESFLQHEVAAGIYSSWQDAVEAGVTLLRHRRELMDRLTESRRQLDEGEYEEFDEDGLRTLFQQLIARAETRK